METLWLQVEATGRESVSLLPMTSIVIATAVCVCVCVCMCVCVCVCDCACHSVCV